MRISGGLNANGTDGNFNLQMLSSILIQLTLVAIETTFNGNVILDSDSTKLKLGDNQDTEIYHNGSHSLMIRQCYSIY